jgi:SagB-type dehydrogenase family enzyme
MRTAWQRLISPAPPEPAAWEIFHENSKLGSFTAHATDEQAAAFMQQAPDSLSYDLYPSVALPEAAALPDLPLGDAIVRRATPEGLVRRPISLENLAALLHCACGVSRDAGQTRARRPLRTAPSAGALYPIEVYFHTRAVDELSAGLYHYNPVFHELHLLGAGDHTARLASTLVQQRLAVDASLLVFLCAFFERTVRKYGERGYRFALLEAGHIAQNLNLAACGIGLGSINVGGFLDRQLDALIGLDGLMQSVVYVVAVGGVAEDGEETTNHRR